MTFEIFLAFALLIGALIVFMLDRFPIDFVALGILAVVLALGPVLHVSPDEAISGFSSTATITVLAMFILSGAIERTGVVNLVGQWVIPFAGGTIVRQIFVIMLIVGPLSAFINNTAAVAILMPMVISLAREHRQAPSKLLIPLSFFAQLAGVMTLIGTSTNILASSLTVKQGYPAFSIFEFSSIGILIFATGALYLLLVGHRLLPDRRTEAEIVETYQLKSYLTEVVVLPSSPLVDQTVLESQLREQFDVSVLEIIRNGQRLAHPLGHEVIQACDILFIKANTKQLFDMKEIEGLELESDRHQRRGKLENKEIALSEVVIGRNSDLIGGTLETTNFRQRYNCVVIALQKHEELIQERLSQVTLSFGDTLLLRGPKDALAQIKREAGLIVTEEMQLESFRTEKAPVALAIIAGVVIFAVLGQPILVTSIIGCVLVVLTGCLTMNELHDSIRLDVIFLLAGVIPLGLALEKTGGAQYLAQLAAGSAAYVPPLVVLSIFYLMTMTMTELISNNATVVVMIPVGVATAELLGLDARAFILAIMFAASTSFSTPVGYQTNTMIYGPGGYKFFDFTRVGLPLNLLLALVTPIYIYLLWGL
ncbi:MAG: SLC13 family permease [Anaerolineaceae bacterium]|nr:SLC13 family permease [Anaerolineaceae bacterium]